MTRAIGIPLVAVVGAGGFAIALAQGGEFAFVLFQFSRNNGVLPAETIEPLISAVAISMFLTPLMFLAHEKCLGKGQEEGDEREADDIEHHGRKVILAGFGRLGTDLGRFLISAGIKPVIGCECYVAPRRLTDKTLRRTGLRRRNDTAPPYRYLQPASLGEPMRPRDRRVIAASDTGAIADRRRQCYQRLSAALGDSALGRPLYPALGPADVPYVFPLLLRGECMPLLVTTQYVDVRDGQMPDRGFFDELARVLGQRDRVRQPLRGRHLSCSRSRSRGRVASADQVSLG